jgi:alkylated DNA nucleotide flippase Atl1
VKNQYFGDRRDFCKLELLLDLAECQQHPRLLLIPMLTPNDGSTEGSVTRYECGARRRVLFDSFRVAIESGNRDIRSLREVLPQCGVHFLPYRDAEFFDNTTRQAYFDGVPSEWLANSVVFVDPDIGLETGTTGYMRGNGLEKYLFYGEVSRVAARATDDSILVVYQHLQRDASRRAADVERRLRELSAHAGTRFVWAIQWADLAFLVAVRERTISERVRERLRQHAQQHGGLLFEHGSLESADTHMQNAPTPERCRHGMDGRFCSLCNPASRPARRRTDSEAGNARAATCELREIVRFLNEAHVRATYGAVAELVGGVARGIGARLTALYSRSPDASWVVSAESGMPTGYAAGERHPALLTNTEIISSGRELEQRMAEWRRTR